jgi:hypothetical protein
MSAAAISGTVTQQNNQWDAWVTGDVLQLSNGGSFGFTVGGGNPFFSKITLFYIKEPGAGTMTIKVSGATVGTVDASDTAIGLGIFEYSQTNAQSPVVMDVSGGAVRIVEFHRLDNRKGVDAFIVSKGGIALNNMLSTATGRANFQTYVAHVNPHLFTFEMKESSTYLAAELNKLGDILDAAAPSADKLFCGSTPMSNSAADADQRLQNTIIEGFSTDRGYAYFDKYKPFVLKDDPTTAWPYLNSLGWGGDGTHVATAASAYTGKLMIRDLGLSELGYAYSGQPVSQRTTASQLARGTN